MRLNCKKLLKEKGITPVFKEGIKRKATKKTGKSKIKMFISSNMICFQRDIPGRTNTLCLCPGEYDEKDIVGALDRMFKEFREMKP